MEWHRAGLLPAATAAAAGFSATATTELTAARAALAHRASLELERFTEHLFPSRLLAGSQYGEDLFVQLRVALLHFLEVGRSALESTLASLRGTALESALAAATLRRSTLETTLATLRRTTLEATLPALRRTALEATLTSASALALRTALRAIRLHDLSNLVTLLIRKVQLFTDFGA